MYNLLDTGTNDKSKNEVYDTEKGYKNRNQNAILGEKEETCVLNICERETQSFTGDNMLLQTKAFYECVDAIIVIINMHHTQIEKLLKDSLEKDLWYLKNYSESFINKPVLVIGRGKENENIGDSPNEIDNYCEQNGWSFIAVNDSANIEDTFQLYANQIYEKGIKPKVIMTGMIVNNNKHDTFETEPLDNFDLPRDYIISENSDDEILDYNQDYKDVRRIGAGSFFEDSAIDINLERKSQRNISLFKMSSVMNE